MFFWFLLRFVVLIGVFWWTRDVVGRFREDVRRLRQARDWTEPAVTILIWLATLALLGWAFGIIRALASRWM